MILQCDSNIKVSFKLPVASRYRRDMTEKYIPTLKSNKQQQLCSILNNVI